MVTKSIPETREKGLTPHVMGSLAVCVVSGLITWACPDLGIWQQWTVLVHTGIGVLLSAFFLAYLAYHFRRTSGLRKIGLSLSGITSVLVMLALIGTGLVVTLRGQTEAGRWIMDLHVWVGAIIPLFLGLHFGLALIQPLSRERGDALWKKSGRLTLGYLVACLVAVVALSIAYVLLPSAYEDKAAITPYTSEYGPHPFRPSQTETASGGFMDPRRIGESGQCAACHADIARQWKASIHAQAASDKSYQTNINLLAKKKGMPATRYCEGCHAPVALLSGQLSIGGRLDTVGHLEEGVSCMACHGIAHINHTQGVASFTLGARRDYLFEGYTGWLPSKLHNYLVRLQPRQHRQDMAQPHLSRPELCATCHVQFMDRDMNNWGWVQMQDEYTAWLASPYSGQTHQTYSETEVRRCQDCHFPLESADDPSANADGEVRSHRSPGANTAIPWVTGNHEQLEVIKDFLRKDKMRISIDVPDRPESLLNNRHIKPLVDQSQETPDYVYLGEVVKFTVIVSNAQVGHNFPGGTIDLGEAWLDVSLRDGQNREIYRSGALGQTGMVDPSAYFYKSIPVDRSGAPVWRHDLFNMVGDSFRRIIPSGKSDTVTYSVHVPGWVKSPITIGAVLRYRKFNDRYARWALENDNPVLPVVDMASDSQTVAVRLKPEVTQGDAGLDGLPVSKRPEGREFALKNAGSGQVH